MNWNEEIKIRYQEAKKNLCRDLVEVTGGQEWKIRQLEEQYPEYLWKFTEGLTVPSYVLSIAKQLEREFRDNDNIPTDLYPCEYFRIMEHSQPTDMALQPKRFDKIKPRLIEKMQKYYDAKQDQLIIPDEQLIARIACAARINGRWHRARLENAPNQWLYVYLVDEGISRQILKSDIRRLPLRFGHYPPMVVRAKVRGAHIQRMSIDKIDMFRDVLEEFEYLTRCQITSSMEPYQINICHPIHSEFRNMCPFLLAPVRGEPGVEGTWIPQEVAKELKHERSERGSDSDFDEDVSDIEQDWEDIDSNIFLRSLPPAPKAFRIVDNSDFEIEIVENEHKIFLTNGRMRKQRQEIEKLLSDEILKPLPDEWKVFGAVCSIEVNKTRQRAVIYGVHGEELDLLLVDYGTTMKAPATNVHSIFNNPALCVEPTVTLISLNDFEVVHLSRIEILREILPPSTPVKFVKYAKSKDVPTKGFLYLKDDTSVTDVVNDEITRRHLNVHSRELVLYDHNRSNTSKCIIQTNFVYKCLSSIVYKKSKLVLCPY